MRRRQTTAEPPRAATRRCPGCGAANGPTALRCTICGDPFASAVEVSQLWGEVGGAPAPAEPLIDLYADDAEPGVFRAAPPAPREDATPRTDLSSDRRPALGPTTDPWASASGTLAGLPGKPDGGGFAAPGAAVAPARRRRGAALRTALLTLLLIVVVGGVAAWFAGRPFVGRLVADTVGDAVDDRLDAVAALPVDDRGRITVAERDVNRALRAGAPAYEPITSPRVALSRSGVRVLFSVYGVESTLTGKLAVEEGRVVVVDPVLTGAAGRLLDVDETVEAVEEAIDDLLARNGLRPVTVKTSDDTLVITTEAVER